MKKNKAGREKTAPVQAIDLVWAKGSSGFIIVNGRLDPTDEVPSADQPPGGSGG